MNNYNFSASTESLETRWQTVLETATVEQLATVEYYKNIATRFEGVDIELALFALNKAVELKPTGKLLLKRQALYLDFIEHSQLESSAEELTSESVSSQEPSHQVCTEGSDLNEERVPIKAETITEGSNQRSDSLGSTDIDNARQESKAEDYETQTRSVAVTTDTMKNEVVSTNTYSTVKRTEAEAQPSFSGLIVRAQSKLSLITQSPIFQHPVANTIKAYSIQAWQKNWFKFVFIPWFAFAFYLMFIASDRYVSQAQLIVKQPDGMSTLSADMNLLSGLGVSGGEPDAQLVKAYILSNDMLQHLIDTVHVDQHFSHHDIDFFSRLSSTYTRDELLEFYRAHIEVLLDPESSIISIDTQGFTYEQTQQLNLAIIERAEWFINKIGHDLATAQLGFIKGEHQLAVDNLESSKAKLLGFQQKYNLLDAESEGAALQSITYELEANIAQKQAEIKALTQVMSASSSDVQVAKNDLLALQSQLSVERNRLSRFDGESESMGVILAKYSALKLELELASQAFSSSLVSLEKSRIEAYRQIKYLMVIQSPTLPETKTYPKVGYNALLAFFLMSLVFGIVKIVLATVKELK